MTLKITQIPLLLVVVAKKITKNRQKHEKQLKAEDLIQHLQALFTYPKHNFREDQSPLLDLPQRIRWQIRTSMLLLCRRHSIFAQDSVTTYRISMLRPSGLAAVIRTSPRSLDDDL